MAIYIVDGLPRHGKTYWVVQKNIVKWLKEAQKYQWKIFSNVWIKTENINWLKKHYKRPADCIGDVYNQKDLKNPKKLLYYWRDLDAWNNMTHGTIICDEAQRYFNSRQWQLLSSDTEMKLTQHGKDDLDVYAVTQHYTRIDPVLRTICEKFYRIRRKVGFGNTTFAAQMSEYYLHELEKIENNPNALLIKVMSEDGKEETIDPIYHETFFMNVFGKKLYDTKQPVLPSKPVLLRHVERFCGHKNCRLHKKPKISHI